MPDQHTEQTPMDMPAFTMPELLLRLDPQPDPDWPLGRWCQYILLRYMRDLLEQREVVWRNEQVEGVHQIRVAARRLRTALQTFSALWNEKDIRRHTRFLAGFADTFGVARDLDVMIIYLEQQLSGAHRERRIALEWMLARKRRMREQQQPLLEQALRDFEERGYAGEFSGYFSVRPEPFAPQEVPLEG